MIYTHAVVHDDMPWSSRYRSGCPSRFGLALGASRNSGVDLDPVVGASGFTSGHREEPTRSCASASTRLHFGLMNSRFSLLLTHLKSEELDSLVVPDERSPSV